MLRGTVIFAHQDASMVNGVMNLLRLSSPALHLQRALCGEEALMLQSVMRADAVLMGMDMPDMSVTHLLCELKRDIVDPYVMICSRDFSREVDKRMLRMGANSVVHAPVDAAAVCTQIEAQLRNRSEVGAGSAALEENMLQRIFMDQGISCSMKGYAYLKCAVRLLAAKQASIDAMSELYEMIALRHGSIAKSVERSIRYAIERCWEKRGEGQRPGNREFLIKLMEECRGGRQTIIKPRVSIITSGRRVFR